MRRRTGRSGTTREMFRCLGKNRELWVDVFCIPNILQPSNTRYRNGGSIDPPLRGSAGLRYP